MQEIILLDEYTEPFEVGKIDLKGSYGRIYPTKALYIPDYGWVPCSISLSLQENFTNDPKYLAILKLVNVEEDIPQDDSLCSKLRGGPHAVSTIWVIRRKINPQQCTLRINPSDVFHYM